MVLYVCIWLCVYIFLVFFVSVLDLVWMNLMVEVFVSVCCCCWFVVVSRTLCAVKVLLLFLAVVVAW